MDLNIPETDWESTASFEWITDLGRHAVGDRDAIPVAWPR